MPRKIIPDVISKRQAIYVAGDAPVIEAAALMRKHDVGAVLIEENDNLQGILTVNDMACRIIAEDRDPKKTAAREVMTPNPDTVTSNTTAIEALRLMHDGGYRHLPVVDDGRVLGVVSRRDFFGLEKARLDDETALWERIG